MTQSEVEYRLDGFQTALPESALHEVEERAILDAGQDAIIQREILARGGSYLNKELIEDIYFCPEDVESRGEMEARGLDREIIRLRRVKTTHPNGEEALKTVFTTKLMSHGDYGDWVERNSPKEGDHLDAAAERLQRNFKLKPFFRLVKLRSNWQLEETIFSFDTIPPFGNEPTQCVLEGEIITTTEKAAKARGQLQNTFRSLEIRPEQKPETSVTNQLIHTRSILK